MTPRAHAVEVAAEDRQRVEREVAAIAATAGMPMPRIEFTQDVATGRSDTKTNTVVLNPDLARPRHLDACRGVLAHEQAHLEERHLPPRRVPTIVLAACWTGFAVGLCSLAFPQLRMIAPVAAAVCAVGGIAAAFWWWARERQRELAADRRGAHLLGEIAPVRASLHFGATLRGWHHGGGWTSTHPSLAQRHAALDRLTLALDAPQDVAPEY